MEQFSSDINPFQLLQVNHKATCREIKATRDKLLLMHHPEKNSCPHDIEIVNENVHIIFKACKKLLAKSPTKIPLTAVHKKSLVNPNLKKKKKKRSSTNKRKEDSQRPCQNTQSHSALPSEKLNNKYICNNLYVYLSMTGTTRV